MPDSEKQYAYDNRSLGIGYGQTISQPYIVALMCDLLVGIFGLGLCCTAVGLIELKTARLSIKITGFLILSLVDSFLSSVAGSMAFK